MPVQLSGENLDEAVTMMSRAVEEARYASCDKDQRGVIIVKGGKVIGKGANGPPQGFACVRSYCGDICSTHAVHAEMRAIAHAVKHGFGLDLQGSTMYHARTIEGRLVESRKPRCAQCSKHLIEFGVEEFILKHPEGYFSYCSKELHRLSLDYVKSEIKQADPFDKKSIG
ncbi:MAG: deaminase [Nanoarchaeota archaeon]